MTANEFLVRLPATLGDACHPLGSTGNEDAWARQTLGILANDTSGVYRVEVRPGFEETKRETQAALGANPSRLRDLRRQHDRASVLASYPL
jgi:hypothetical protein